MLARAVLPARADVKGKRGVVLHVLAIAVEPLHDHDHEYALCIRQDHDNKIHEDHHS